MNNTGRIMTAIAAGAVAGFVVGILFAPDKGSETRKKIDKKTGEVLDQVKDKIQAGKEKIEQLAENLKQSSDEFKERFKTLS
jgi:gas vesicle protein